MIIKYRHANGLIVARSCDSVLEGQQMALNHGAEHYTITLRGNVIYSFTKGVDHD